MAEVSSRLIRCGSCGTEYAAGLPRCPSCGKAAPKDETDAAAPKTQNRARSSPLTALFFCLVSIAFLGGLLVNFSALRRSSQPVEPPAVVELAEEPTPPPTPKPTPTVNSIKVYAFGRELDADGFTAYVGDRPFMLYAELDPAIPRPVIDWSMSDTDSAAFSMGDDALSCEFTALKPSGRNELTVRCYGAETVIPVFLWER